MKSHEIDDGMIHKQFCYEHLAVRSAIAVPNGDWYHWYHLSLTKSWTHPSWKLQQTGSN